MGGWFNGGSRFLKALVISQVLTLWRVGSFEYRTQRQQAVASAQLILAFVSYSGKADPNHGFLTAMLVWFAITGRFLITFLLLEQR